MKRVLFIINSLNKGGAERVVASLANFMANRGHEIVVLCFKNSLAFEIHPKVKVVFVGENRKRLLGLWKDIRNLNSLIRGLEEQGSFDIVTTHLFYAHVVTRLSKIGKKAVYVMHTVYSRKFKNSILYRLLIRFLYSNKKIVTVSQGLKQELKNHWGVRCSKDIIVINNPIDIEYIKGLSCLECDRGALGKYIISMGRLTEGKRFPLLIKAFLKSKLSSEYKLVILGEGEKKAEIINSIEEASAQEQVILKEWQENPFSWIKNASLYACTSSYECFPMSILESLCCGTPIVSIDCDYGPREILIGELKRFLVKEGDFHKLIENMEEAVENYPPISDIYYSHYDIGVIAEEYLRL